MDNIEERSGWFGESLENVMNIEKRLEGFKIQKSIWGSFVRYERAIWILWTQKFEDNGELATRGKYAVLGLVTQSCPILCKPMDCSPQGSSVHVDSPENTGVGCHAFLQGNLPNSGIKLRCPTLQVDSLLTEPPGKPKNTRVGSLSLLQEIFPIQESNQGLLYCR